MAPGQSPNIFALVQPVFEEVQILSSGRLWKGELSTRVEQPMSDHLSASGRPDPRGGLHCFWCPDKT
jgi:hypothetical protein